MVDTQECEPAFGGKCTEAWRTVSHEAFEGAAVQHEEGVRFHFSTSALRSVLHCRTKTVSAAPANAVRVRILASEGTNFARWQPRAATHVDALSRDDRQLAQEDAFVFARLPGLERVLADDGCTATHGHAWRGDRSRPCRQRVRRSR
jgi:hypothetical protein